MKSICMNYFYGLMEPQLALSKRWTAIGRYLPVVCYVAAVVVTTVVHCGIFMPAQCPVLPYCNICLEIVCNVRKVSDILKNVTYCFKPSKQYVSMEFRTQPRCELTGMTVVWLLIWPLTNMVNSSSCSNEGTFKTLVHPFTDSQLKSNLNTQNTYFKIQCDSTLVEDIIISDVHQE